MNKVIATSTILCAVIGVLFTILGIMLARPVLQALDTPGDIIDTSAVYLITMVSGTLVVAAYNMASSILRALGDGKTPLIAMIIAALLNIGLDIFFVLALKWGVFGAAFASVLSQLVSFVYCFIRIKGTECIKIEKTMWKLDFKVIKKLISFSVPLSLQFMVIALGGIILQSTINAQGSFFVAGYTAVNKLYGLIECTAISLGTAFTTFFAQNFGAGKTERIRQGMKTGIAFCVSASLIVSAVILLFGKYLLMLFLDTSKEGAPYALEVGWKYLWIMALCLAILYIIYVYRSFLQAAEISIWSMVSGFGELFVRVFMGKTVILWCGIDTLFFIEPIAWVAALLFVMLPYLYTKRAYFTKNDIGKNNTELSFIS